MTSRKGKKNSKPVCDFRFQSTTFSFGEPDGRGNERQAATAFLHETSSYRAYYNDNNNQKNDDREYDDEYYSHESYDNISGIETTGS